MSISRALPRRENTISGTPTTAGTFTFTVRVTDDLDTFSEKELSITITRASSRRVGRGSIVSLGGRWVLAAEILGGCRVGIRMGMGGSSNPGEAPAPMADSYSRGHAVSE